MIRLRACGLSDVGRARQRNEDAFAIDARAGVCVVADGMGGHSHGDVASRIAVATITDRLGPLARRRGAGGRAAPAQEQRRHALREAVEEAQGRVLEAGRRDGSLAGMGTTVVSLLVDDAWAWVAHVGDSRAYRLRDGRLERLTEDHTWVNEQLSLGHLTEEQVRSHPFRSVVTRALGSEGRLEVEVRPLEVVPGDLFLLCSDGLTAMLSEAEIRDVLSTRGPLEETCRRLVAAANARGGVDNVTAVVAVIDDALPGEED